MIEKEKIDQDNYNRLAGLIISLRPELVDKGISGYLEAVDILKTFTLTLVCGQRVGSSKALQAALLTSLNTGKRCFLGGVQVQLTEDSICILPGYQSKMLSEVVIEGGGVLTKTYDKNDFKLFFGLEPTDSNSLAIVCSGWTSGVKCFGQQIKLKEGCDFSLPGVFAGALGVGLGFLRKTNLNPNGLEESAGISFWQPQLDWLDAEAQGPQLKYLPDNLWLLGLGHLGQANAWTLSLLPYKQKQDEIKPKVQLHDFDKVIIGNYEAGLLCDLKTSVNQKKTRICSSWLEDCGFETTIVERPYDQHTIKGELDPPIMLSGLDSPAVRKDLRLDMLKTIIDAGVGGELNFDSISINNLAFSKKTPMEIWGSVTTEINLPVVQRMMDKEFGCGFVKGISTSFVGAITSCFCLAEVIRGLHKGVKTSVTSLSIRKLKKRTVVIEGNYSLRELFEGSCWEAEC